MRVFIESLNAAAPVWVDRIWGVVWQSTILIVIVAIIASLFLRHSSPAIRYWVWQVLAIKILLMPFWTYAIPLPRFAAKPPSELVAEIDPIAMPESTNPIAVESPPDRRLPIVGDGQPSNDTALVADVPRVTWPSWLLIGWGFVVIAQLTRLVRQRSRLGRLLRQAVPADDALAEKVQEAAARLGLKRVPKAVLTESDCSPFVCGIRRAVIVLPKKLAGSLNPTELSHVLLHELAHVRRRDLAWGWVGELARVVYFFHPVVHWLCYRIRLERELACDQMAMAHSGGDAGQYAATLVRVVSHSSEPSVFKTATTAGLVGEAK